jgi:ferredoxin
MAEKNNRLPQNAPGPWYIDSTCIDCDLCRETAPTVFQRDEESGNSIVFHQPATAEELKLAEEAKSGCPVEAIGCDDAPVPVESNGSSAATTAQPDEATRRG